LAKTWIGSEQEAPLLQADFVPLRRGVGPSHEGVEKAFLHPHLFPNRGALKPDALLRFRTSLIAGGVEDQAVAEVPPVLHELNDGLRKLLFQL
jgi:hypothetical protein